MSVSSRAKAVHPTSSHSISITEDAPPTPKRRGSKPRLVVEFPEPLTIDWIDPPSFPEAFALQLERHGDTCWHLHKAVCRPDEKFDRKTFQQWAVGARLPNAVQSFDMLARVEHRYRLPSGYFRAKLTNTGRAVVGHQLTKLPASERRRLAWHLPEDFDQRPRAERDEILHWIRTVIISGSTDYRRYQAEAMKVR